MWTVVCQGCSVAVAVLVLVASGCNDKPTPPAAQDPPAPPANPYRSLGEGWKSGGGLTWRGVMDSGDVIWQDRDVAGLISTLGMEKQPARPVYLVFMRVPPGWKPHTETEMLGAAWTIRFVTRPALGRPETVFSYEWTDGGKKEALSVGKDSYALANGRVFLMDATGPTPSVVQVSAGLNGLFEVAGPDYAKLAIEMEALRITDARVQRFWAGGDPAAEDAGGQ